MRSIRVIRYANQNPYTLTNGDKFDSILKLFSDDGRLIYETTKVNVDPSVRCKDRCGRIAVQTCFGIVGYRFNTQTNAWNGKRVIKLFHSKVNRNLIKDHSCLSDEDMTIISEIPNPNWNGSPIIRYAQIHGCGTPESDDPSWDWSEGCITILNTIRDYDQFLSLLKDNEILSISVEDRDELRKFARPGYVL